MTYEIRHREDVYDGAIIAVHVDTVAMPGGGHARREVVRHDDSVAVVARDDRGRVLLLRQYRHPLGRELVEIPAGLRDVEGEAVLDTARRELREEVGLTAATWTRLLEVHTSPGILTERATVYLAEDLATTDREPEPGSEETGIVTEWVTLEEALARVRDGRITDSLAVGGLFATADHLRRRG